MLEENGLKSRRYFISVYGLEELTNNNILITCGIFMYATDNDWAISRSRLRVLIKVVAIRTVTVPTILPVLGYPHGDRAIF